MKILVIDDNTPYLDGATRAVERVGFTALRARNVADSQAVAVQHVPELCVVRTRFLKTLAKSHLQRLGKYCECRFLIIRDLQTQDQDAEFSDFPRFDVVDAPEDTSALGDPIWQAIWNEYLSPAKNHAILHSGTITIDPSRFTIEIGSRTIELTKREMDFVYLLALHPGKFVSSRLIFSCIWNDTLRDSSDSRLDVFVTKLRKKLEPVPSSPTVVTTKRGAGYKLCECSVATDDTCTN